METAYTADGSAGGAGVKMPSNGPEYTSEQKAEICGYRASQPIRGRRCSALWSAFVCPFEIFSVFHTSCVEGAEHFHTWSSSSSHFRASKKKI